MSREVTKIDLFVSKKVKIAREESGTQTDLANHLGVTFQQVQKYENGKCRISSGSLYEICKFTGKPIVILRVPTIKLLIFLIFSHQPFIE